VGINRTRLLVWGTLAETITNIFLDYSLIYGHFGMPALGFNGAAYASIMAEGAGLLVIYWVTRIKGINKSIELKSIPWDGPTANLILVQSSPLIAQYAISILSWEFFYVLVEHHGERALAISNTMRNIFGLSGIFCWAFAAATNTMVSNVMGQGKPEEVMPLIRRVVRLSLSISLLFFLVLNIWPQWFLSFYGQGDAFITEGIPVVRIVSVALLMMSFGAIWLNAVTGTGNTRINLMIEMVTIVMYCLYVYVVLEVLNLPITWGWASEWVYWTFMFSMAFFYLRSGKWKGKQI
jgi:Na+-driven multidrug efflux pump